ncbi:MAG: BatA domain-containing protein, partial [Acetobacteraceae bacterium]|nr:BatA domain-containing protein [Acetobacteraceae bacterium]
MLTLGPIGFAAAPLLAALLLLPVLWWLLRVTPPAPQRQPFPAVRLLRDLIAPEETPHRTPLWLLLLRIAAAALLILGLARPVWNPQAIAAADGPLLIVMDDGWASAPEWGSRAAAARAALDQAGREGRRVALLATAPDADANPPRATGLMPAEDARARLAALRPKPWAPDRAAALHALAAFREAHPGPLETLWIADPVEHDPDAAPAARLAAALLEAGPLTLLRAERPARLLLPPETEGERLRLRVAQTPLPVPTEAAVLARTGDGRVLARATVAIPAGATEASAELDLPAEIRNRVLRLDLDGEAGAGGVVLLDERFRRRPVGLVTDVPAESETPLLGAFWYVDRALSPTAELRRGGVETLLARPLAVIVLADRPVSGAEETLLARFVEQGGMLIRFAGPRTAERADALLPVPLRGGERALGGALSWERPQRLAPFPEASPFAGLPVPEEVTVSRQVLAEPGPALAARTWARLADGTPLVTAEARGAGRIVLFHVTAEATWSDLPLSGLFVEMLRRLVALSAGVRGAEDATALPPLETLDGFGVPGPPGPAAQPVAANAIAAARPGPR